MNKTDPIDVIRRADPVDPATIAGFPETARGQEILARIVDDGAVTALDRRRRRMTSLLRVAAIAAVGALGIAAAVSMSRSPVDPLTAGCYHSASQQANITVIDLGTDGRGAIELCTQVWTEATGQPVPESLVACVVTGGGLGVFPADPDVAPDATCAALGASTPVDGDYAGLNSLEVRRLQAALRERHDVLATVHSGCVPVDQAVAALGAVAEQHGATTWRTVDLSTSPCTDFFIDFVEGHILIIDDPPPPE